MNQPSGLDEPTRPELERFEARYQALRKEIQEVSLSILIWGPNLRSDSPVARVRNEIREELINLGHNAMFSEDLLLQASNLSEKTRELERAQAAHLIIILIEDAPGALAEAHDFGNHPAITPNLYVMIPSKYREQYSTFREIRDLSDGYGGVYWYEDEDLENGNLRKCAVQRAEARRRLYYFFNQNRRDQQVRQDKITLDLRLPAQLATFRDKHSMLVDKKFREGLSETEEKELSQINDILDDYDAPFYEPIERRLSEVYDQLLKQANQSQPETQ